ncbi:hypothetical protein ACRRVD_04090 [Candidatus Cardinium hertigii]|uniref:hypothetical protein n=1 Tax=Candidatus Cardinium hertigii TaxID=247481 RepID=UPI003D7E135D
MRQSRVKYIPSIEVKDHFEKKLKTIHQAFKEEIKLTKKQSKEKGKKQGRQEGIRIGQEKGKMEIAKSMLQEGDPVEKIIRITGLSIKQVEQLNQVD